MTPVIRSSLARIAGGAGILGAALVALASPVQAAPGAMIYKLSPPGLPGGANQFSPYQSVPGSLTETFDSMPVGAWSGTGGLTIGTYTVNGAQIFNADQYGGSGGTGRYARTDTGGLLTINVTPSKYLGFQLSALNGDNTVRVYDSTNALLGTFTAASMGTLLGTPSSPNNITAVDGNVYSGADYYGNPNNRTQNAAEAYTYMNLWLSDPSVAFSKIEFSGNPFEFDSITISPTYTLPPDPSAPSAAPGPLPVVGAAAALGWSRRLRRRIQSQP